MKTTITFNQFADMFNEIRPDNFSMMGLKALFNSFEDYEEESGMTLEPDVIAVCCEYTEYSNLKEIIDNYTNLDIKTIENLQDYTYVMEFEGGIIVKDF